MKLIWFILLGLFAFASAGCVSEPVLTSEQRDPFFAQEKKSIELVYPIANFPERVTLKPFGIYITPSTSPVQPERFEGYHTGADAEVTEEEQTQDVPIVAIAEGVVRVARQVDGYGGVVVIEHQIKDKVYMTLYGHLNLNSLEVAVGNTVSPGQLIGFLGEGYSEKTDDERKHLHFSIKLGATVDLRGYVQTKSTLNQWINPLTLF
ncbi:MAG: membrane protein [uncultured bacterium]|nr:MAG: membrane protein [uncultured bacterium]